MKVGYDHSNAYAERWMYIFLIARNLITDQHVSEKSFYIVSFLTAPGDCIALSSQSPILETPDSSKNIIQENPFLAT